MIVVNIFGGPGIGKSTISAEVYAHLKKLHVNAELAREFAKEKVWEKSLDVLKDQVHILGEQHHRQFILKDQCQVAITDSPILLCCIYNKFYTQLKHFDTLALEAYHEFENLNYVLERSKDYQFNPSGRVEDMEKSIKIDSMIEDFLSRNKINFKLISHNHATNTIVNDVLHKISL